MSGASLKVDSSERGESRPRVFNCSLSSTMRSPVKPRRARRSSCNIAKLSREGKRKNQNDRSQSPERLVHWCGSVANDVNSTESKDVLVTSIVSLSVLYSKSKRSTQRPSNRLRS